MRTSCLSGCWRPVRLATPCRSPWRSRLHRVSQGASVSGRQGFPPASRRPGRERIARIDALSICIGHISLRGGTGTPMGTWYTRGSDSGRPAVALTINLMRFPAPTRRRSLLGIETACTSPLAFRIRRDIGAVLLRPIAHGPFLPVMAPRQRPLYLSLGRLPPRTSRNSFGPFRSRRLRRCRSSSGADGSIRRSISWAAISDAFAAFLVRTPVREALGAWSVTRIDLHSSQTMPAASWSFFSFAFITSRTIGRTFSHVSHYARGKRSSKSMI